MECGFGVGRSMNYEAKVKTIAGTPFQPCCKPLRKGG